ncbi:BolA family transcriptional regulator [bacterium]|nr:MAG: BolA family transcriptional regulator [bacterium]|tara:strand:- start:864 stop:1109 length:246 start_codon:yes stop_codon:yes gene_type:complete
MIEKKIKEKLKNGLENAEVFIQDMTGTNDHFNVMIISKSFEGLNLIERHRLVYKILDSMVTKEIHALQLKTLTLEQWKKEK